MATETEKKKRIQWSVAWQEARGLIWQHRRRLSIGLALMLVSRLAGLVLPATSKYLIDEVAAKGRAELLPVLAIAAAVAAVVQGVTGFALSQVLGVAAQRLITEIRKSVQEHIIRLPSRYFDSTQAGVLISRVMTDAEGIRNLVGSGLVQLCGSLVTATAAMAILFWLNWQLTLVNLVILAVFGTAMSYAFTRIRPIFRERGRITAEVSGRLGESFGGIRVVKAYTAERREKLVFARGAHRLFRNVARAVTGVSAVSTMGTVIAGVIGCVMIALGGRAILAGEMTVGDFVMYVFFTGLLASPVIQIASIGTQISEAFAGLDRIREVRSLATEDEEDRRREPLGTIRGDIAFEDVTFSYDEGNPVLKHVSFEVPAGSTTALVGSSGSGKSTLVSLVMAFNRPDSGRITVDGRDLDQIRLYDYRGTLGVVLQDNFLFDGTVAENIRFGRPGASMEEVLEAARLAHCDDFVSEFPDGYETVVGERGIRLSGGQRQRIAIARALLAQPRIMILDEATSSLDSESEARIQEGLNRLREGRTTFVIAHRLSTIRSADQILVLESGEILERGTHEELLARGGRYRQLYEKQYRFEMNRFINPGEEFPLEHAQV